MSQTAFVQQMLDKVYPKMNDPASGANYMPAFLQSKGYDPYGPFDFKVDLTAQDVIGALGEICGDIQGNDTSVCPSGQLYIAGTPNPSLTLSNVHIHGLSNAVMLRPIASGDDGFTIADTINFSTLPPNPPGATLQHPLATAATLTGNFTLTQYCCCSADASSCSGKSNEVTGTGTFVATVNKPGSGISKLLITKLAPNVLTLAATHVDFQIPVGPSGGPDVTVQITIENLPSNFPPGKKDGYDKHAMAAFNSESAQKNLISQINQKIMDPGALKTFGAAISGAIDAYLKANHKYPFNGAATNFS